MFEHYADLTKISFDYAVVEKEKSLEVLRYSGTWKDLGTWNTLTEAMEEHTVGDVRMNDACQDVHIYNGPLVKTTHEKNIVNRVHRLMPEEAARSRAQCRGKGGDFPDYTNVRKILPDLDTSLCDIIL